MQHAGHTPLVRITHWINAAGFLALMVSGAAILIAHPRFYWGETGGAGSPALFELPLPPDTDHSGWGRSLHFLAAWVCVFNGLIYVARGRFARTQYSALQRAAYRVVVFALFPLMILTGLAMSPAVNAAIPALAGAFGGHQSARTIHFAVTLLLTGFFIAHVAMIWLSGFKTKMRGMLLGEA